MKIQRPEHTPRGYEWLPDAFHRDIEPGGDQSLETARRALAEGDVEACLLDHRVGQLYPIAERMWTKPPLSKRVFPRFRDGWMQMRLELYTGPYVEGWIFVKAGYFASLQAQTGDGEREIIDQYRSGSPGRPSSKNLILREFEQRRKDQRALPKLADEAKELREWLDAYHPYAPQVTEKTIKNNIRGEHRKAFPKESLKIARN